MLTSKIIAEIIENHSQFLGARIAATNLFQVDLDKPYNYLWLCYENAPRPPLPFFWKVRGKYPRHFTALRRPWNYLRCCYLRAPVPPLPFLLKVRRTVPPSCTPVPASLARFTVLVSYSWACSSLMLHCVAKLGSGFSCCWSLLRSNNVVHFKLRHYDSRRFVTCCCFLLKANILASALTFRDFVSRLELFNLFRDFRKSLKMCKMNHFSLYCKSCLVLFLTLIMVLRFLLRNHRFTDFFM